MYTLNTVDRHAVYAMTTGYYAQVTKDTAPTLLSRDYKDAAVVTDPAYGIGRDAFNQGKNAQFKPTIEEETQPTLVAKGPGAVAAPYGFDPSATRDVGQYFLEDCGNTLVNGTCPGHHNGVVETSVIGTMFLRLTAESSVILQNRRPSSRLRSGSQIHIPMLRNIKCGATASHCLVCFLCYRASFTITALTKADNIVFRIVYVLFVIDSSDGVIAVVVTHSSCPTKEANGAVRLEGHNIIYGAFGWFCSIPVGDTLQFRIAHKTKTDGVGFKKDINLLVDSNEFFDFAHNKNAPLSLLPKESVKKQSYRHDRIAEYLI